MKKAISVALGLALIAGTAGLAGCSSAEDTSKPSDGARAAASSNASSESGAETSSSEVDLSFTDRDKDPSYDAATATRIELSGSSAKVSGDGATADGSVVNITTEGTYLVQGTLSNGMIEVNLPGENDKAQIVLDSASIHNESGPAINIQQADKIFLTLAEGSANSLTDGKNYNLASGEDEPYAALYSKDDLTINGSGTLEVTGNYRHGIASKDDLVITGGDITVTSAEDAVRGNDAIKIGGGSITVTAGDDAFNSNLLFYIADGNIDVKKSYEGIEAEKIYINGGTSNVVSSDDGVNAVASDSSQSSSGTTPASVSQGVPSQAPSSTLVSADGQTQPNASQGQMPQGDKPSRGQRDFSDGSQGGSRGGMSGKANRGGMGAMANPACVIEINCGTLIVDAGGDGLDSNGSIEINGGDVYVSGASNTDNSGLDFESSAVVNGGNVICIGSAGMGETFTGGTQTALTERVSGIAGSTIEVKDSAGKVLLTYEVPKAFQLVCASAPGAASITVR